MLWGLLAVLVILWLLGFATNVVGGLIHILLVLAVIVLAYQLITGRRAV
ncbi:MAG TPA: lmo0937 family membrane protein [Candidatus Limnocylindrales bacterium]|nr:lmo0937 family membrane protein [Candidatus Limnocylindrales bacterium]